MIVIRLDIDQIDWPVGRKARPHVEPEGGGGHSGPEDGRGRGGG